MKKIFNSLVIIVFALVLVGPGLSAQENRTVTTKIADLLAQMPANNLPQRDKLMEELISLGDEGFQQLADQMTPSGKGDNTAVVYAINGLARYACQNSKEDKRAFAEKNGIFVMGMIPFDQNVSDSGITGVPVDEGHSLAIREIARLTALLESGFQLKKG